MKTISLLHTVPNVFLTFEGKLREAMPGKDLLIHNTLDAFLASDANIHGFTQNNLNRLQLLLQAKSREGADVIVATCSTLTPWIKMLAPLIPTPIICVDDAMAAKAVSIGTKMLVMATAQSTLEPSIKNLRQVAAAAGKELDITSTVNDEAYTAVKKLEIEIHDRLLKEQAAGISGYDVVVLAQASMAHLEQDIQEICGIPTVSSPELCVNQVKETLFPKG